MPINPESWGASVANPFAVRIERGLVADAKG
jgi:hypothetical protein